MMYMLDTDFHWFHCSCCHSLDTILGILQIFVMREKHRLSLISLFLSSFPRYHPWFSLYFCDARRSSSSVALPSFDFTSCIELHRFYCSCHHSPDTTLCLLYDTRISISSVTLSSLDCSSYILLCNSTRWF